MLRRWASAAFHGGIHGEVRMKYWEAGSPSHTLIGLEAIVWCAQASLISWGPLEFRPVQSYIHPLVRQIRGHGIFIRAAAITANKWASVAAHAATSFCVLDFHVKYTSHHPPNFWRRIPCFSNYPKIICHAFAFFNSRSQRFPYSLQAATGW